MTEYLRCWHCGYLNELPYDWRNQGDPDDTHYVTCKNCKRGIWINNKTTTSKYLFERKG